MLVFVKEWKKLLETPALPANRSIKERIDLSFSSLDDLETQTAVWVKWHLQQ
jgi:hypothetical protein